VVISHFLSSSFPLLLVYLMDATITTSPSIALYRREFTIQGNEDADSMLQLPSKVSKCIFRAQSHRSLEIGFPERLVYRGNSFGSACQATTFSG
jgi:hypothetical protein